jgi:hypothetical protein
MPNSRPCVVVPHSRFLEYQDQRRKKAAQPVDRESRERSMSVSMSAPALAVLPQTSNEKQC